MSPRSHGGGLARTGSRSAEYRVDNRIFYIIAEGRGTEYDYLGELDRIYGRSKRFLIRMPSPGERKGLTPSDVVERACQAVRGESPVNQVWGLFDHDRRDNGYIDQTCMGKKPARVKLALSHPSFELWLLLHFQDFTPARQHGSNGVIMDKLRAAHPAFANYDKRGKRITAERFDALTHSDGIANAARRARRLMAHYAHEMPSSRDPSTEVFRLIEALGIVSRSS